MGGPPPLPTLEEFERSVGEAIQQKLAQAKQLAQEKLAQEKLASAVKATLVTKLADILLGSKQASQLDKELPRDVGVLMAAVRDPELPPEHRAKILEVIIYRGAINDVSYAGLGSAKQWAKEKRMDGSDFLDGKVGEFFDHEDEFAERRRYQEAARDAIFRSPDGEALFVQLTKSPDQLPQGRTAATEFMNTMLRNGGIYGSYEARQEFEKEMLRFSPDTRGRMMYQLLDAAQSTDIHDKGERRKSGDYEETGIQVEGAGVTFGVTVGRQFEYVADNHFREVGKDISRQINADLNANPEEKPAFEAGFKDAASLGGGPN